MKTALAGVADPPGRLCPRVLVLLHGQPGSAADWQQVTGRLPAALQAVAVDRPGYGANPRPPAGFAANARAVLDDMDSRGIERAVLVGHSYGGGVALMAASMAPHRVEGVVLLAGVGPGCVNGWDRLLAAPGAGPLCALVAWRLTPWLARARLAWTTRRRGRPLTPEEHVNWQVWAEASRLGRRGWRTFLAEQRALVRELDELAAAIPSVRAPVLLLTDPEDRLVPLDTARRLAQDLPDARLRLVRSAGHHLPRRAPEAVAHAIAAWLRDTLTVMATTAPLDGLTVVEVSSFIAAPLGGLTLAQLGADVIRIDPVGGGPDLGRWPLAPSGTSLYWTALNKGKRSVTLNFRDPEGRGLLRDLVAASGPGGGIVLTNAGQDWLAYPALAEVRPDLIHLQIQGHRDGRTAVDYTVNAETGFPYITGPEGLEGPVNHVLPAWDVSCGLYAAVGLLAAERRRQRTGEGSAVTLALADVAMAVAGHLGFLAEAQVTGTERPRIGNHLYGGLARDFRTADGERVMVVVLTRRHLADLGAATGLAGTFGELERLLGADFGDEGERYRHREVITALLEPWFAGRTLAEVERGLAGTSVLWSRYRRFTDLVASGGLAGNPLLAEIDQPGVGLLLAPGSPLDMAGALAPRPAPAIGADTASVLTGMLGLRAADVRELAERGIV